MNLTTTTYVFEAELVETEFKVNDGSLIETVRVKEIDELATNLFIKLVVGKVETKQGRVLGQSSDHILNSLVFFAFVTQIIGLEVEVS